MGHDIHMHSYVCHSRKLCGNLFISYKVVLKDVLCCSWVTGAYIHMYLNTNLQFPFKILLLNSTRNLNLLHRLSWFLPQPLLLP